MSGRQPGSGARHFLHQRITAIVNIPLTLGLVTALPFLRSADYDAVRDIFGHKVVGILAILLIVSATIHMRLGMQTIIEDYIHDETLKLAALTANTLVAIAVAVAALFAILSLSFGA